MKRLSKEVLDLRHWLRKAQQRNKELSCDVTKKIKEAERKERIIVEKNERIRKVSQEVESTRLELKKVKSNTKNNRKRKGVDRQKSVTEIQVDQLPIEKIDTLLYNSMPIEILVYDIPARWKEEKIITVFKNLGLVKRISIKTQFKYKLAKMEIYLKKEQNSVECFQLPKSYQKLSEIREMYKFMAYKEIKEEWKNLTDKDIMEAYGDYGWFFGKTIYIKNKRFFYAYFANQLKLEEAIAKSIELEGIEGVCIIPQKKKKFDTFISNGKVSSTSKPKDVSKDSEYIYTKKDMEETVAKVIEDKVKECEMMWKSVQQSVKKIIKMMGWSLSNFDLDGSNVNKDRQTPILFEEIQKVNVEQVVVKEKVISLVSSKSLDEEEIVDIIDKYRKNASLNRVSKDVLIGPVMSGHVTLDKVVDVINDLRKEEKSKERSVTEEDMDLYIQVNQNCSSRLPKIKKEEISEDEKIGQKRVSKEEVSRGDISSSDSDGESGSENIATEVAYKKSGQVGKGKKGNKTKKKSKKKW
ncbi:unnamed protein product [Rhizophagus irregularis]|nr:unnamed protein product [Rhizophagus irregularis]